MRRYLKYIVLSLALLLFAQGSRADLPNPTPKKLVFTKINASASTGVCITLANNSLNLSTITGALAKKFAIDPKTVQISPDVSVRYKTLHRVRKYLSASQTWKISDSTGEGVGIENDSIRSLIIVSRIDRPLTLSAAGRHLTIPGHCLFIVNNPPTDSVLDFGAKGWIGFDGHYKQKMSPISSPTLVEISPNADGIEKGFPEVDEGTIINTNMDFGTE